MTLEKMAEDETNETAEAVFLRYSYPCGEDLVSLGLITKQDLNLLEDCRNNGRVPSREIFERLFPNALSRIERLANSLGKDKWNSKVIRQYFLGEHNNVIEREEGLYKGASPTIKDSCKVRIGEIVKKEVRNKIVVYSVKYQDKTEPAVGIYLPDANVGDRISTHWKFAIEKVSPEDYNTYSK